MAEDNSIFFQCKVLDTEDPMMLGRIRAIRLIDNLDDVLRSVSDPPWNEEKDIWTARDPLVFNSLLPYFVYSTPKKDELAQVIYLNKDFRYQNQYYVQNGTFSSPTSTYQEYWFGGNKFSGNGTQIKNPKPLKNQDGTFTDQAIHAGVFPQPGDNALLGRGSADLVVKQDEVLLRAGKFKGELLQPNVVPVANQQRAFLQLSRFQTIKQKQPDKTYYQLKEDVVLVKYLVEWVITNPENTKNNFTGSVYLYKLKPDVTTNSKNLTVDSIVNENLKVLVYELPIQGGLINIVTQINDFLKVCNTKNTLGGFVLFPDNNKDTKFPIFYRASNAMYSKISASAPSGTTTNTEINNLTAINTGVKLTPSIKGGGGLIYTTDTVGTPSTPLKIVVPQTQFIPQPATYGAFGGDKLFLLSHNSAIPGKGKINFDNTLYGISPEQFGDEIVPKTSSMVRGEELMELINLIVRFLVTHTHAYPGLPPVPVTQDGTQAQEILSELQNAVNTILNGNIRLN
jgi:hypothetical protein